MPDQIFISYRRDDAAYVTGHINDLLRKEFGAESVFTDVDNIALGVDFRKVLDESVSQCQVFLAVIGDNWLSVRDQEGKPRLDDPADFVRIEIESALKRNIPIIPLLVGRAQMPKAEDLPESLRDLAFRNGTPIRPAPDFNPDMDRLIRNLRRYLQSVREQSGDEQTPTSSSGTDESQAKSDEPAEKPYEGRERRSTPRQSFMVGEDERARRQAELGSAMKPQKKRGGILAFLVAVIAIVAGGWYYADRNPAQLQALLHSIQGSAAREEVSVAEEPATNLPAEAERAAGADVGAPTSFGAATVTITEDQAPAVDGGEAAAGNEAPALADAVNDETSESAAGQDAAGESVDAAPESVADTAGESDGMIDGEVVLTPGTQRQADVSELISEGVSLAAVDDHEAAIRNFNSALELDTEAAFVYRQRAASYQALDQHEAAIADYDEAIRINSDDVNAHYRRGASNIALGNYAAAVLDYDAVILLDPEFADAYTRRAAAHEALGNTAQAAQDRATAAIFESNRQN